MPKTLEEIAEQFATKMTGLRVSYDGTYSLQEYTRKCAIRALVEMGYSEEQASKVSVRRHKDNLRFHINIKPVYYAKDK